MLSLVATPIGNLGDMTPRALDAMRAADVIACEDTRRTWALLTHFGIPRPAELVSYRQGNEERVGTRLLDAVRAGRNVVLCSDGGCPGISDPGFRLVQAAAEANLPMTVLPGASAVTTALMLSGLPTSSFTFKGFPPRKPGALHRFFVDEAAHPHTLVVFEAPYRLAPTLAAAHAALGDRRAALCLELTKLHESVRRGWLSELHAFCDATPPKGEAAIVIAGLHPKFVRVCEQTLEDPAEPRPDGRDGARPSTKRPVFDPGGTTSVSSVEAVKEPQ
jgi:16S rRNA (cytidine1402-2'-O)-methyltransferase